MYDVHEDTVENADLRAMARVILFFAIMIVTILGVVTTLLITYSMPN